MEARAQDLLETVQYRHAVFTLPDELAPVALQNKEVVYNILFRSVSETPITLARDRERLDAEIGFLAILHTWGQTLSGSLHLTLSAILTPSLFLQPHPPHPEHPE